MRIATIEITPVSTGVKRMARTFDQARTFLRDSSKMAPTDGYDKHDVVFTWLDGTTFGWRADVNRSGEDTDPSLYLRDFARRIAAENPDADAQRYRAAMRENAPDVYVVLQQVAERILSGDLASEDTP